MAEQFHDSLADGLQKLHIQAGEKALDKLRHYYEMVLETNQVMNLTTITEEQAFIQKHLLDSSAIVYADAFQKVLMQDTPLVMDLGTGAGLPGIVLKILFPKLRIVLMDSLQKRLHFLDHVIEELDLDGIETLHARAEELGRNKHYREQFDLVVSRAVANLTTLSEYCLPFVKCGGVFISYKSGEIDEELTEAGAAIQLLGGELQTLLRYSLPDSDLSRSLVVVHKARYTPQAYPRKPGTPAKAPLISIKRKK